MGLWLIMYSKWKILMGNEKKSLKAEVLNVFVLGYQQSGSIDPPKSIQNTEAPLGSSSVAEQKS